MIRKAQGVVREGDRGIFASVDRSAARSGAPAAYFHESKRPGLLWLQRSRGFVSGAGRDGVLGPVEASQIVNLPQAPGLFRATERTEDPTDAAPATTPRSAAASGNGNRPTSHATKPARHATTRR
jgi:hypothetical protein